MNIVWFSWKDGKHPAAGGAETVSRNIMERFVRDGHHVRLITARYPGSSEHATVGGIEIFRTGGRFSVYPKARRLFKKQMADWPDLVIDEMNTLPFGVAFYTSKPSLLLTYQLARRVWFYQMPVLAVIGYLLEPLYLLALSRRYKLVLTESESTRSDLRRYGFRHRKVEVFRVGIGLKPLASLPDNKSRSEVLVIGAMRAMKRTLSAVKAFETARDTNANLTLTLAGNNGGRYGAKVLKYVRNSRHAEAIKIMGHVSPSRRLDLLGQASVILVTSIKEGWGLTVTEANSQGTPAIAYDTDGLRDSIRNGETGLLVESGDYIAMGMAINQILSNPAEYDAVRRNAWTDSQQYTFDNSYKDFVAAAGLTKKADKA